MIKAFFTPAVDQRWGNVCWAAEMSFLHLTSLKKHALKTRLHRISFQKESHEKRQVSCKSAIRTAEKASTRLQLGHLPSASFDILFVCITLCCLPDVYLVAGKIWRSTCLLSAYSRDCLYSNRPKKFKVRIFSMMLNSHSFISYQYNQMFDDKWSSENAMVVTAVVEYRIIRRPTFR